MSSVTFYSGTNLGGNEKIFNGAQSVTDLNYEYYKSDNKDDMNDDTESLVTGSDSWLAAYSDINYGGDCLRVGPSQTVDKLDDYTMSSSGDKWGKEISSFILYDYCPASWQLSFDLNTFNSLFPDNYNDSTISGNAIGYMTQDCTYRIYNPTITYPDENSMLISVTIDHIISMSTDDHVELGITIASDGSLAQVSYSWDAGSNYQIPKTVMYAIDAEVEAVAALTAVESLGASEVIAAEFIEDFDTACKIFNKISNIMAKWSENDGGRFYLIPVVSHVIGRVCSSVSLVPFSPLVQ